MVESEGVPCFDELYAVSDLHMGGEGTGSQIFDSGAQLAGFITFLTKKSNRIAAVFNGDTVDFLAEPKAEPFDPHGAARKLIRIISDPAFKDV